MTEQTTTNYPDLLGAMTRGGRLNLDVVQCALAVRPARVPAGQFFDLILVLQNASDSDVDAVLVPEVPEHDAAHQKGRFMPRSTRLRIGLQPAEVGFMVLSVATSPITQPGGYSAGLNLEIKRLAKKAQRVRAMEGGGAFALQELPEAARNHITALHNLAFSIDQGRKKTFIQAPFEVISPALTSLKSMKEQTAEWVSLWTMRDFLDESTIVQKVWPAAQTVMGQLKRDKVFMPLLKVTQERFQASQYPLLPPEAIFITKALTLVLEAGVPAPTPAGPRPTWPHWFVRLCRLLLQEPALAGQIETLATRLLYSDLLHDTVLSGFSMVSTVANEDFGSAEEAARYADDLVKALNQQQPLNFARAYFPLVLAGLISNARVTMPREQIRETVFILSKALEKRRPEKNQDNQFVFDLAEKLIERALDAI